MVALARVPVFMSVTEFLAWDAGDDRLWQLVDGEPQAMAPPAVDHGILQSELGRRLGNHLDSVGSPCVTVTTPGLVPRVQAAHNVRIPDLAVTCSDADVGAATLAEPVLVVEILSPSNQAETWGNVWAYTSIPSVREIVVLHTVAIRAEVLRRGPDGTWPPGPEQIKDGDLVLDSIGMHTPLADLYRGTRLRRAQGGGPV